MHAWISECVTVVDSMNDHIQLISARFIHDWLSVVVCEWFFGEWTSLFRSILADMWLIFQWLASIDLINDFDWFDQSVTHMFYQMNQCLINSVNECVIDIISDHIWSMIMRYLIVVVLLFTESAIVHARSRTYSSTVHSNGQFTQVSINAIFYICVCM